MSLKPAPQPSAEALLSLQSVLDRYIEICHAEAQSFLKHRLSLKECLHLQSRHFIKDLLRNPINALWAVPYFSIRKIFEVLEKLGWETGRIWLQKIPQAFKTDFQKEAEKLTSLEIFGLSENPKEDRLSIEFEKEIELKNSMAPEAWDRLLQIARKNIRASLSEYSARQNGFTDLAATGGVLLFSQYRFGDRSLDIFGIGRKTAGLWAKEDAVSHFAFGKKLGHAFYNVVPPPPPTTFQILWATAMGIAMVALLSTAVGILSYPLQKLLGFRKKQLEVLVDSVGDKLLVELTKFFKKSSSQNRSA